MAGGGGLARGGEHAAEGIIAKAAAGTLRDAERAVAGDAARAGARDAARTAGTDAAEATARDAANATARDTARTAGGDAARDAANAAPTPQHVDLDSLPDYHQGGQPDLFGSENVPGDYDPYAGHTRQEFYDEHWDPSANDGKGNWDYPPDDGFDGPPVPNTLQEGDVIDRYGYPSGTYTSPNGTDFAQRALPPTNLTAPYYRYEVVHPPPASVTEGRIAPAFGQPGGGVQHFFDKPIEEYLRLGYLKQVYP